MNKFQILDSNGKTINVIDLDKEAAEFWGTEVDGKFYTHPLLYTQEEKNKMTQGELFNATSHEMSSNWFDVIGYRIANPGNCTTGWNNVRNDLWTNYIDGRMYNKSHEERVAYIEVVAEILQPFMNLIKHWEDKGYTPKQLTGEL